MAYPYPSVDDFKEYFSRDFPYGTTVETVQDTDIAKAQIEASFNFNPDFAVNEQQFDLLFNYLTAHYLVIDLQNAAQGQAGGYSWLEQSKSVGSVSQAFAIPERSLENASLAMLSKTSYGAKYLQLILPQLCGQMGSILGRTRA